MPRFLITAGNTREAIDQVRDWGNIFTGQTGLEIANALLDAGDVTLCTSNLQHARAFDGATGRNGRLAIETFRSHADLRELLAQTVPGGGFDAICMTAAVADYTPAGVFQLISEEVLPGGVRRWTLQDVSAPKVPSTFDRIAIAGRQTEKLVDLFRAEWGFGGLLVKFKLQAGIGEEELLHIAENSRVASGADYIVANTLEMVRGECPGAWVLGSGERRRIARPVLAHELARLLQGRLACLAGRR